MKKDKRTLEKVKAILKESERIDEPLLTIELQDEHAVPKVFYKGEEIEAKRHISFDWRTKQSHEGTGGIDMRIEHYDNEVESLRIIGRKRGEFM